MIACIWMIIENLDLRNWMKYFFMNVFADIFCCTFEHFPHHGKAYSTQQP